LKWFWGLIQIYSIVASFISLMQVHTWRVSCNPRTRSNWHKFWKSSLAEL
jgi:hypothetical protein